MHFHGWIYTGLDTYSTPPPPPPPPPSLLLQITAVHVELALQGQPHPLNFCSLSKEWRPMQ